VVALAVTLRRLWRARRAAVAECARIQTLLEQSDLRFRVLTRATNEVVWDWDLPTDRVWWNRNIETSFGYQAEDIGLERAWWKERVHPEDRASVASSLQKRMVGNEDFWSAEYRFRRADGSYADVFDRGYILRDPLGQGTRMIGSMMDV